MQWANMTSYEFRDDKNKKTVILPVGAVEAHGPHLPIGTDNILAERLSEKISKQVHAHVLPLLPFGQVWSLQHFPGSISIRTETLTAIVTEIGESIYSQGFEQYVIVNAHLGNETAIKQASRNLYEKLPDLKTYTFFYPDIKKTAKEVIETDGMHHTFFHADEIETSIMLYLAEEEVDMSRAIKDIPSIPADIDFTPIRWNEFTQSAVLGDATKASKEKGKRIVEHSIKRMVDMINKV